MTRDECIKRVAILLCQQDGKDWVLHPSAAQSRAQSRYEQKSAAIVTMIEGKMLDFKWDTYDRP